MNCLKLIISCHLIVITLFFNYQAFAKETILSADQYSDLSAKLVLTGEEKEWIKDHPVLKVASESNWPPFEYKDEQNQYKGISVDMLKLISV